MPQTVWADKQKSVSHHCGDQSLRRRVSRMLPGGSALAGLLKVALSQHPDIIIPLLFTQPCLALTLWTIAHQASCPSLSSGVCSNHVPWVDDYCSSIHMHFQCLLLFLKGHKSDCILRGHFNLFLKPCLQIQSLSKHKGLRLKYMI